MKSRGGLIGIAALLTMSRGAEAACPADDYDPCGADCYRACDCSYAKTSAAVAAAPAGGTVMVPAGSCTWDATLTLQVGVSLIGSGSSDTIIARGGSPLIVYSPPSGSDFLFRVSGFGFDMGGSGKAIELYCDASSPPQTQIRIDHNRVADTDDGAGAVENWGCRGVVDSNRFENLGSPLRNWGVGDGLANWQTYPELEFGSLDDNFYVEDNVFTGLCTYMWADCDQGGRYAYRYNSVSLNQPCWPLLDMHGGRGSLWGTMGAEVYGNLISANGLDVGLMAWRGGRLALFANEVETSSSAYVTIYNNNGCPPDPYGAQQLHNSGHIWLNRNDSGGALIVPAVAEQQCGPIAADVQYWQDNPGCEQPGACADLTTGIGCGPLASRPASCVPGTAYWATDQGCGSLSGLVGDIGTEPARSTIQGTLYKCTDANTWSPYFTPMVYPHPLREQAGGAGGVGGSSSGDSGGGAGTGGAAGVGGLGAGNAGPEPEGCGCRLGAASRHAPVLALPCLAAFAVRRYRRRPNWRDRNAAVSANRLQL